MKYTILENGVERDATEAEIAEIQQREAEAAANAPLVITAENRAIRNDLLTKTDWTQLPDVSLTVACVTAFQIYRQALRDVDLLNPVWPEAPAEEWA